MLLSKQHLHGSSVSSCSLMCCNAELQLCSKISVSCVLFGPVPLFQQPSASGVSRCFV